MSALEKIICQNKKAHHDYFIEKSVEAGIVLSGSEVKSLRAGKAQLMDAYADFHDNELHLHQLYIEPYSHATHVAPEPRRTRKLLMHRRELASLQQDTRAKGVTLVPLKLYFKGPIVKVDLGLARGKKKHDKRESVRKKDNEREMRRIYKVK